MTTQEKINNILLLARHLLSDEDVTLHVQSKDMEWGVWVDHKGFRLVAADLTTQATLEAALDSLLETLTTRVHKQMEDATKILEFLPGK